jgi:hypothetical protein
MQPEELLSKSLSDEIRIKNAQRQIEETRSLLAQAA